MEATLLLDAKHLIMLRMCALFHARRGARHIVNAAIHSTRQSSEHQLSSGEAEGGTAERKGMMSMNFRRFPSRLGLFSSSSFFFSSICYFLFVLK